MNLMETLTLLMVIFSLLGLIVVTFEVTTKTSQKHKNNKKA